jgi:N-terminal domain of reverse transcriptase
MEHTKAADENPSEEGAGLPWRQLERHLYRLQKRIFKASERGDLKTVHKLQKLLMRVAVRPTLSRATSEPGQPGQENRWQRWSQIRPTSR